MCFTRAFRRDVYTDVSVIPVIQNLVKSFDGDQITIDTIVEPGSDGSDIKGTDQVSKMAKRALKKRS